MKKNFQQMGGVFHPPCTEPGLISQHVNNLNLQLQLENNTNI